MKTKIANAYISLGSNLGDRAGNLLLAVRGIMDSSLEIVQLSHIYETVPIETVSQPNFLNMVAELRGSTLPSPESLMARLLRVEYSLGRTRDIPKGPRTIDLDLLLYQNEKRDTELLKLPHPRLPFRRFVLVPLAELSPQLLHPVLHKTVAELLEETSDRSAVHRWTPARSARQ
ncbi:MAG TPA: 2-amino-4-hydroxy-6-hydroxymethyldihydropteridine diphosphokinase [Pyrinomonadaceae bacterium]|nr:2-amino-4-hydroxy-6-hydroxymethyldihydropteridine diphosphokinase [Pyrinomonadaceae bacterium]